MPLTSLRRLSYAALGVALTHLIFGAIVRISGSGMGCGEHWPKCFDRWIPPFDQPIVVIEWTHRLLASLLLITIGGLVAVAYAQRDRAGVSGRGGVLRAAATALGAAVAAAIFGMVTVKLGNAPLATVGHWTIAATVLAALAATAIRAGGLGGAAIRAEQVSAKTRRGAAAAAGLALLTLLLGGLTAKIPGANAACQGFPLCRGEGLTTGVALDVHVAHRLVALLLLLHVSAVVIAMTRRQEATVAQRAGRSALALLAAQIGIAAAMVELHLPAPLRSLHQAVGVGIWLSLFSLAYLCRVAAPVGLEPVRQAAGSIGGTPLSRRAAS